VKLSRRVPRVVGRLFSPSGDWRRATCAALSLFSLFASFPSHTSFGGLKGDEAERPIMNDGGFGASRFLTEKKVTLRGVGSSKTKEPPSGDEWP